MTARRTTVVARLFVAAFAVTASLVGCGPPAWYAGVASCSELPPFENYRGPDRVAISLRVSETMGHDFDPMELCLSIDGRVIRQEAPAAVIAGFAAHAPLDLQPYVAPGVAHSVHVVAAFRGRRRAEGYRFAVQSTHQISAADLHPGELQVEFLEKGGADMPFERRPTAIWTGLGAAVVAPP